MTDEAINKLTSKVKERVHQHPDLTTMSDEEMRKLVTNILPNAVDIICKDFPALQREYASMTFQDRRSIVNAVYEAVRGLGILGQIIKDPEIIIVEMDIIIRKFNYAVPLSEAFADFAERSGLEDVASFASIYKTIEGRSSRADEIVRETQQIIADKMEIEMEIDTLMSASKSEVNIMLFLPLVILLVIGYAGSGFLDALYTTPLGRLAATGGLVMFIVSYFLAQKFSSVKL